MWDPLAEFETSVLPNGLTVHTAHWPNRPWVRMTFIVHTGSREDPVGREGLAHFVEHMVASNTPKPSAEIIDFFVDAGGSVELGGTGEIFTDYSFYGPIDEDFIAEALRIFGHMLSQTQLEQYLEREREVIIGEFNRRYSLSFNFDIDMREGRIVFPETWKARMPRPLGTLESIMRISAEDLQSHYERHYAPTNISVICVGGLSSDKILELIGDSPLTGSKSGTRTPIPKPVTEVPPPEENRFVFNLSDHFSDPPTAGSYYSIVQIPATIKPQSLRLFLGILDKILFKEIREKRTWAYQMGSSYCYYQSFYSMEIFIPGLATKAIPEIEEVIENCIAQAGESRDSFEQMKHRTIASRQIGDIAGEDLENEAAHIIRQHYRIKTLSELIQEVHSVTFEDIQALLLHIRPPQRWIHIRQP